MNVAVKPLLWLFLVVSFFPSAAAVTEAEQMAQYFVSATAQVTLTIPITASGQENLYRDARGKWVPLPNVKTTADTVTFTLSPEQLAGGRTTVLLGKPKWLVVDDTTPPHVTRVLVDGKNLKPTGTLDLGWLDVAPQNLEIHFADSQNPLDARSVYADIGGSTVRSGNPGFRFLPNLKDSKKGRIICALKELGLAEIEGVKRIVIHCDDFAPDESDSRTTFTFTVTRIPAINLDKPSATTADGIRIYVDSICPGYENVDCMFDGKLQVPGTTTYGSTWASGETSTAHWMCMIFPKAREISGIEISWANYQNTFWTAERYAILSWDGTKWVDAVRVQKNQPAQTSTHSFSPRTTDRILVWVPPGGNHPARPDLMWVTEVKLLP